MRTSTTVQPGHRGAQKFVAPYGDRLVCVRYRYAEQRKKRFKPVMPQSGATQDEKEAAERYTAAGLRRVRGRDALVPAAR